MRWSPLNRIPAQGRALATTLSLFPNRSSGLGVPFRLIGMPEDREHALLVASSGGHLAQLLALQPWWQERGRTWVTFGTEDARSQLDGEHAVWAHHPTTRNIPNLIRNFSLAVRVMRRDRPDVVVSTGAAV